MKREHSDNQSNEANTQAERPSAQTTPLFILTDGVIDMHVGKFLEEEDKAVLGVTNQYLSGIFKKSLDNTIKKFLKYVAYGDEKAAEPMAKRNPDLILQKDTFTDPAGRTFKNISGLQYSEWSQDCFMKEMLLSHLPKKYSGEARKQLNEVKRVNEKGEEDLANLPGIEYTLTFKNVPNFLRNPADFPNKNPPFIIPQSNVDYIVSFHEQAQSKETGALLTVRGEKNYDYQPILVSLKKYLELYQQWVASHYENDDLIQEMKIYWCKSVGLVQRFPTAFLAQYCCHYNPYDSNTDLVRSKFNRTFDFYDHVSRNTLQWFPLPQGLGSTFAILRDVGGGCAMMNGGCQQPGGHSVESDLKSIINLEKLSKEISARVEEAYFAEATSNLKPRL